VLGEGDAMAGALFKFNPSAAGTPFQTRLGMGRWLTQGGVMEKATPGSHLQARGVSGG